MFFFILFSDKMKIIVASLLFLLYVKGTIYKISVLNNAELTLKVLITTAADDNFMTSIPIFEKKIRNDIS